MLSKFACPGCLDLSKPFGRRKYAAIRIMQYSVVFSLSYLPYVPYSPSLAFKLIYLLFSSFPLSVCHNDYYKSISQ